MKTDKKGIPMKLLVVLGEGGHTTELLNLVDLLEGPYEYHYVVSAEDNLSVDRIRRPGPIHSVWRPRGKDTPWPAAVLRTMGVGLQSVHVLLQVRPTAILSSGPAIAVPISLAGRLLGVRILYVECAARVTNLSMTGRIMYNIAHRFFVQWPQLKDKWPRALYEGRLL
jgi:beta-1,4-N-acetylglucosaminyltransferase